MPINSVAAGAMKFIMKTVVRILLVAVLLSAAGNSFAATKTIKISGLVKIHNWAQKVGRLYATAARNLTGADKAETANIYVYAYDSGGFSAAGNVGVSYSNANMPVNSRCGVSGTIPVPGSLPSNCPGSLASNVTAHDFGAYTSAPSNILSFQPHNEQMCVVMNYGFAACMSGDIAPTVRASCISGARKVVYDMNPVGYCGIGEVKKGWSVVSYARIPEEICLANSAVTRLFAEGNPDCSAISAIAGIKNTLQAYRGHLLACNTGLVPSTSNYDLIELDEVLGEIQNGVVLAPEDIQGDTNPPPAQNPWLAQMPRFALNGPASQTFLIGNPLPEKLKVKVTNPDGTGPSNTQIAFSVPSAPGGDWKFDPGVVGQPVTLATINGTAETGFNLGATPGTYSIKATCTDCCPSEVSLSATGVTENDATELKEVFCDGTYFAGQKLPYPLRVKAYNKFTKLPREGVTVTFSKTPADKGEISVLETQTTGPSAIARTFLTLGPLASGLTREQYTITATCPDCHANTTVTCPVEAVPVPNKVNPQTDLELFQEANGVALSILPNVVAPKDSGGNTEASVAIQSTPNTDFTASIYTVPFSGGHQHNVDRPVGTWKEQGAAPQNVYKGKTDAAGKAVLTYVAGIVGGEERIEVLADAGRRGQKFVFVRVTGLAPLQKSSDYKWHSGDNEHPNYWYAAPDSARQFGEIARKYKTDQKVTLRFNDLSLISGGILDSRENWTSPHLSHRKGTGADVNSNGLADVGVNPQISLVELDKIINGLNKSGTTNCCRIKEKDTTKIHIECPKPGVADPIPLTCTESTK